MVILSHNNGGLQSLKHSEHLWQQGNSSTALRQEQDSKDEPFALSQSLIFGCIRSHDRLTSTYPDSHILRPARPDPHREAPAAGVFMGIQQIFLQLRQGDSAQTEDGARCCTPGHCQVTCAMPQAAGRTGFTSRIFTFASTIGTETMPVVTSEHAPSLMHLLGKIRN